MPTGDVNFSTLDINSTLPSPEFDTIVTNGKKCFNFMFQNLTETCRRTLVGSQHGAKDGTNNKVGWSQK